MTSALPAHVWLRCAPEAALEALPDQPDPERGFMWAFRLADGRVKLGFGSHPKGKLRGAIAEGRRNPEVAVEECLVSVPHHEYWKTEFPFHNRLMPLREFGDVFNTDLDMIAAILAEVPLKT